MTAYRRYSVFVVPDGAFYRTGAGWLGWDSVTGNRVNQPDVAGLPVPIPEMTATPRRYGFHGTIRPPFRLSEQLTAGGLHAALHDLSTRLSPVSVPRLRIQRLGSFVAIVPDVPSSTLSDLATAVVTELDRFRAPLTNAELAKRRKPGLTKRQDDLLTRWGYPFVLDEFRFHLTLTGRLGKHAEAVSERLADHFGSVLPSPFRINELCLMGEAEDGRFHLLERTPLGRG